MHPQLKQFRPAGHREPLLWFAVCWDDDEEASKRAWRKTMDHAQNTHFWRVGEPPSGPTRWIVIGMGARSTRAALEAALAECDAIGGYKDWDPPTGFLQACALRRLRLIAERAAAGDYGMKVIEDKPRRMDRQGGMHDA